jgi:hypothetical protein
MQIWPRFRASGWHLLVSVVVAALTAGVVFGCWYPGPYRLMSGGQSLFVLVISVDLVLGPLLTFAVFDLGKGWRHLCRDLAVIGVLQFAGLSYGLHTVYAVRPVALVFEVDRFRVVTASDVYLPELPGAAPQFRSLPLTGPWLLAVRPPLNGNERKTSIFMALEGVDVGQRPSFWKPYDEARDTVIARARPIELLLKRYPERAAEIETVLRERKLSRAQARFLPVMARGDWVAVLDSRADIATFLDAEGFF